MPNCHWEDKIKLPAKKKRERLTGGVGRSPLPPLATILLWYTAWWVLMSDGQCRGLVGWFGLVCGPSFVCVTPDAIVCDFVCVFVVFSSYSGYGCLQTKNHQNLWNSLVITPTTTVDVHSSCLYAGVDGIYFALKDHQQVPPHLIFARPRAKSYVTMKHDFKSCYAIIKVIPCHFSYLWIFEVSTMSP